MGKFRLRLKLQGLEVEIDGEREDIPAITSALDQQFAGLVQPIERAANGNKQLGAGAPVVEVELGKAKGRARKAKGSTDSTPTQPIEFRHDSAKFGNPIQTWSVTEKVIWLLFVLKSLLGTKEVSGPDLAATFNNQFKSAGKLHPPNVTRDLAKLKVTNPAPVGEDKGQWFLTDEGEKQAQQLIKSVLNPAAAQ
jgi:hypothetical protein